MIDVDVVRQRVGDLLGEFAVGARGVDDDKRRPGIASTEFFGAALVGPPLRGEVVELLQQIFFELNEISDLAIADALQKSAVVGLEILDIEAGRPPEECRLAGLARHFMLSADQAQIGSRHGFPRARPEQLHVCVAFGQRTLERRGERIVFANIELRIECTDHELVRFHRGGEPLCFRFDVGCRIRNKDRRAGLIRLVVGPGILIVGDFQRQHPGSRLEACHDLFERRAILIPGRGIVRQWIAVSHRPLVAVRTPELDEDDVLDCFSIFPDAILVLVERHRLDFHQKQRLSQLDQPCEFGFAFLGAAEFLRDKQDRDVTGDHRLVNFHPEIVRHLGYVDIAQHLEPRTPRVAAQLVFEVVHNETQAAVVGLGARLGISVRVTDEDLQLAHSSLH